MAKALGELQLQTLVTQTSVGVLACDAEGRLTLVSKSFQDVIGEDFRDTREADLVKEYGLRSEDGITPLDPDLGPLARARRGEVVRDAVHTLDFPGRGRAIMRFNAAPLVDDGRIVGAIATVQDITSERLSYRKHTDLQQRLLATLNHEIRTPLAALLGHAELLAGAGAEATDLPELIDAICRASWRLRDIVATVADVVALEDDRPLARSDIDLAALVREVVADAEADAVGAGVTLQARAAGPSVAYVDRSWLLRTLGVLLDSAIGSSPPGGLVDVRLGGNDNQVWINVVDQRPSSTASDRFRAKAESALALVMARMVAGAHAGELRIEELEPAGHRAELLLPRQSA